MPTTAQTRKFHAERRRAVQAVCRRSGVSAADAEEEVRAALEADGLPRSSKEMGNREFNRAFAVFAAFHSPDQLAPQLSAQDNAAAQVRHVVRQRALWLTDPRNGGDPANTPGDRRAAEAYLSATIANLARGGKFPNIPAGSLNVPQLKTLANVLGRTVRARQSKIQSPTVGASSNPVQKAKDRPEFTKPGNSA